MKTRSSLVRIGTWIALGPLLITACPAQAAPGPSPSVGLAVRDITPELPIRLAGYASRKRPADKLDTRLLVQGLALQNQSGERFVFVALDNCEVSRTFMQPVLAELASKHNLGRGEVSVVSSHTHSAPMLDDTLPGMGKPPAEDQTAVQKYTRFLQNEIVQVVGAALADLRPATFEYGAGRAGFAMNRRVYRGDKVVFGDNPDGPVDWDVPVLRIRDVEGKLRAMVFGYACHGTSIRSGDDWYNVSGEYMAYARQHLEALYPGAVGIYLTGMGADSDPSPRGYLIDAKRHGLELAGAVAGVLNRPMRPVRGPFKFAYNEIELPLAPPPNREQIEKDAAGTDLYLQARAQTYLKLAAEEKPLPTSVKLPVAALRLGDDLTFLLAGGEVVVDYSKRLKRLLASDSPWPVAYAYEVPCYIPSARIIKEGGYEADSSLIYYGLYGPLSGSIEETLLDGFSRMVASLRSE